MAFNFKVGSFAKLTTTGSQSVTGVGFLPKALIFWGNTNTTDTTSSNMTFAWGVTDGVADELGNVMGACGIRSNDAIATDSDAWRNRNTNRIYVIISSTGTTAEAASFTSFDSDGFTINWNTSSANAYIVNYLALGGDDLANVYVGEGNTPTSTGNNSIAGVGFKPTSVILLSPVHSGVGAIASFASFDIGMFNYLEEEGTTAGASNHNVNPSETSMGQASEATLGNYSHISVGDVGAYYARFVSMDSDGFTLNWTTVVATSRRFFYLCLKGPQVKINTFASKTTTGSQSITGVSFKPIGLWLQTYDGPTSVITEFNAKSDLTFSVGMANGSTSRGCIWAGDDTGAFTTRADSMLDRTKILKMINPGVAPTLTDSTDFTSFDDDGFTLNWDTVSGTAKEVIYMAFGDRIPSVHIKGADILGASIL